MAEKNYGKRGLVDLLVAMVLFVVNFSFVACDNEEINDFGEAKTFTETVKKDNPKDSVPEKDPELNFFVVPMHNAVGKELAIADTVGERTTNVWWLQQGKAKLGLNEYDYVTEMKYKNLNLAYSNANKSIAEPEVSDNNGIKRYTTKCTFPLEDGNLGTIIADSYQRTEKVNGQSHTFEYAKLNNIEVVSLNNVERAATRGEMYVADSCLTEVKVKLHYVYENSNVSSFDVLLVDTCLRKFLAENDIETSKIRNEKRDVTSKTTEVYSFKIENLLKSGEVKTLDKSTTLLYEIKPIDEWEQDTKSFEYSYKESSAVIYGETKMNRTDGPWTYYRRPFVYTEIYVTPQGDRIEVKYNGFTEGVKYDDGRVQAEAPVMEITVKDAGCNIEQLGSDGNYDRARFKNTVNANYCGYTQSVYETVLLRKEAEVPVYTIFEGWDDSSERKTISLWNVRKSIDYVVRRSDSSETRTTYTKDFGWSFGPKKSWVVYAENSSFITGNVIATVSSSQKSENAEQGAVWQWNENSHSFIADVSVANGTQKDEYEAVTVNDVTITRNGHVHSFGHDDYSMTDGGAKLGNAASTDSEDVYPYAHSLNFGYVGTTADAVVKGEIHVAKVVVPNTFFGKLKGMTFIVANNEGHTDYLYTALAHLEGGEVIPGVWNKNGEIQWHPEWKQQSDATNLNGCAYEHSTGRWVPVHAWDSPDCLQYDTPAGANADNQSYATALQWQWDEGAMVGGHPSVTTDRISYTMDNGVVSVVDVRHGISLGSWTYQQ